MTFDQWFRYIILPAMLGGTAVALFLSLREAWRDWRDGEW